MILRPKPFWLSWFTAPGTWVAFYPYVLHPEGVDPTDHPSIVSHELVHLKRQAALGRWKWIWCWFTDRKFRLVEEVAGMAAEIVWWPLPIDRARVITARARDLAGPMYFHAARSITEAEFLLKEATHAYGSP